MGKGTIVEDCGGLNENGPYRFIFEYLVPSCNCLEKMKRRGFDVSKESPFPVITLSALTRGSRYKVSAISVAIPLLCYHGL